MKVKPLGNRVLIEPINEEEATKSGIILPSGVMAINYKQGTVLEVGNGITEVKKGDRVAFLKYGYDELKVNDKALYVVELPSLIAVYE